MKYWRHLYSVCGDKCLEKSTNRSVTPRLFARTYLFIICQHYVLWTSIELMKENTFTLKNARSRRNSAWTIMDADYANDIALLANTATRVESLLHSLERVAGVIDVHVNTDKKYMCFNLSGDISTLNGVSPKRCLFNLRWQIYLPRKQRFIYGKWYQYTTSEGIDSLSIGYPSYLSDIIKRIFSKRQSCPYYNIDAPRWCWQSV